MAIAMIFVFLFFCLDIAAIGFFKQDSTFLLFSSMMFVLCGLHIFIYGFEEMAVIYAKWFGILLMFLGSYIGLRTALEIVGIL